MKQRAGAPRLIDWTGERFVPWVDDSQLAYEHLHRYAWARSLVAGRCVLDLGCGEGIGASILAETASDVVGVDLDPDAVRHATANYGSGTVSFRTGDARSLDGIEDGSMDAVVAFEVVEHLREQDRMLAQIRRVLGPGGVLLMSTPNRTLYRADDEPNPFHRRELDEPEFAELLGGSFAHVALFAQRAHAGSRIEEVDGIAAGRELAVRFQRSGESWMEVEAPPPFYLLGLASDEPLPSAPATSTLIDITLDIVAKMRGELDHQRARHAATEERLGQAQAAAAGALEAERELTREHFEEERRRADAEVAAERSARLAAEERVADAAATLEAAERRHAEIQRAAAEAHSESERALRAEAQAEVAAERSARLAAEQLVRRAVRGLTDARREVETARDEARRAASEAGEAHVLAARVSGSITWRAIERVRRRLYRPDGRPNTAGRLVSAGLRALYARLGSGAAVSGPAVDVRPPVVDAVEPILLPTSAAPRASVIIPAYAGAEHLERCLRALAAAAGEVSFEVIVVDDDPADSTVEALLERTKGANYVRNPVNVGYLRAVNRGAQLARGDFVVTINSDTEPQDGWLDALVGRTELTPGAAVVGVRLIYPTGSLQEAGGVVYRDGGAVNYGNGESPHDPRFTFARPVDYCSAAALLVRRQVWEELGGFDERYAPAYYEDTDLCFRAREAGYEVWYEPRAVVTHYEGGSHGTDTSTGVKRHQVINRERFADRHRRVLRAAPPRDGVQVRRRAADRRPGPAVLVYDGQIPEPDRDAGSLRMFTILAQLAVAGARVIFVPGDGRDRSEYRIALEQVGVEVADQQRGRPFHDELARVGPTLAAVIICRPLLSATALPWVREFAPRARVIFDTVDLHFAREAGRFAGRPPRSETVPAAYREIEFAMMRATDLTLVVSEDERALLARELPEAEVVVVPVPHALTEEVADRGGREGYMFVGGFRHHPNVDAVDWLVQDIWPAVTAEAPSARLLVIGPDAPARFDQHRCEAIDVLGWVPEMEPFLAGCVALVAPLRYGAGMKGKVSQALACGLPVVTTAVGAQGLGLTDGVDVLLAETPEEFARAVACLESDRELWERLSAAGRETARRVCSVEVVRRALEEHILSRA